MRILVLGLNYLPELTGIGKYTGEMAGYMAGCGHAVRVITAQPYYPHWQVQPGYHWWQYLRETIVGIEVFRAPLWVPRRPTGLRRIFHLASFTISSIPGLMGNISWKPDVVIAIAPSIMNAPFALLTARLCKAKSWLHIQDFELDAAAGLGIVSRKSLFMRLAIRAERWLLKRFDRVSTISNRMMARVEQKGVPAECTYLFPNWVDTELISPLSERDSSVLSLARELDIPVGKVIILYSGNMGRKHGLEYVVEAALQLQQRENILFVFCGDGAVRSELELAAQGIVNVRFVPLQPLEKLNQLLNLADIHVLPQRADAADLVMPSKLSGMLASGKAVIATANPGTEVADIVSELGIVVTPENTDALAEAIDDLADRPDQLNLFGKRGRAWVEEHWSREKVLERFSLELEALVVRIK